MTPRSLDHPNRHDHHNPAELVAYCRGCRERFRTAEVLHAARHGQRPEWQPRSDRELIAACLAYSGSDAIGWLDDWLNASNLRQFYLGLAALNTAYRWPALAARALAAAEDNGLDWANVPEVA